MNSHCDPKKEFRYFFVDLAVGISEICALYFLIAGRALVSILKSNFAANLIALRILTDLP